MQPPAEKGYCPALEMPRLVKFCKHPISLIIADWTQIPGLDGYAPPVLGDETYVFTGGYVDRRIKSRPSLAILN